MPGTLYDFVRRFLCDKGGSATRPAIEAALLADPRMREKLLKGRGFVSLIHNMHHSGDIELDGPTIRATGRTYRRMKVRQSNAS